MPHLRFAGRAIGCSILIGAILAALLTIFFTAWDWLENPASLFRDE